MKEFHLIDLHTINETYECTYGIKIKIDLDLPDRSVRVCDMASSMMNDLADRSTSNRREITEKMMCKSSVFLVR